MLSPRQALTNGGAMVCSWTGRRPRGGLTLFINETKEQKRGHTRSSKQVNTLRIYFLGAQYHPTTFFISSRQTPQKETRHLLPYHHRPRACRRRELCHNHYRVEMGWGNSIVVPAHIHYRLPSSVVQTRPKVPRRQPRYRGRRSPQLRRRIVDIHSRSPCNIHQARGRVHDRSQSICQNICNRRHRLGKRPGIRFHIIGGDGILVRTQILKREKGLIGRQANP